MEVSQLNILAFTKSIQISNAVATTKPDKDEKCKQGIDFKI